MDKLLLVTFTLTFGRSTLSGFMRNRYQLQQETLMLCPDNDQTVTPIKNFLLTSINRTHKTVSYDFDYDRPIGENIAMSLKIAKWSDGRWFAMPAIEQPNVCKMGTTLAKDLWVELHKNAGVPNPGQCPVPAGHYHLKNFELQTALINYPFWAGKYSVTYRYIDQTSKEVLHCLITIIKLIELK